MLLLLFQMYLALPLLICAAARAYDTIDLCYFPCSSFALALQIMTSGKNTLDDMSTKNIVLLNIPQSTCIMRLMYTFQKRILKTSKTLVKNSIQFYRDQTTIEFSYQSYLNI